MKKVLFMLFLLAIPVTLWAEEPVREWKSKSGHIIEASLEDPKETDDPQTVYLVKEGKRFRIPFNNLSQADQEYVTKVREGRLSSKEDSSISQQMVPCKNQYVLLIGVSEYAKPIMSVKYSVDDMKLLAQSFERIGIPKENIFFITDDSPAERRPTGSNIRYNIEKITGLMDPDDQLIIVFSGHGAMVDGKSYLFPSDLHLDDKSSLVSRDWVVDQLDKCKAKQKVFIVDACRNELTIDGARALDDGSHTLGVQHADDAHGFVLISSCDKNQITWDYPEFKHSAFVYFLAEGLAGKAADENGYISIMNLFQYTSRKTKQFVFQKYNAFQVPTIGLYSDAKDFCIGKLPNSGEKVGRDVESHSIENMARKANDIINRAGYRGWVVY